MSNRPYDNVVSLRSAAQPAAALLVARICNPSLGQPVDFNTAHALRKLAEAIESANLAALDCTRALNGILRGQPADECDAISSPEALHSLCSAAVSLIDARGCLEADRELRGAMMRWITQWEAGDERAR